ncbi:MAG: hypothetical protein GF372_10125 [Candidatus Marinimicrobia bacterium]|nr:hypothetical protein [Candidatus Neomarinimicrobiota bacterium]
MNKYFWITLLIFSFCFPTMEMNGQDLDTLWNDFLELETNQNIAESRYESYLITQSDLLKKQQELQDNQTWLNGWINEIRLANVNKDLVAVADSIEMIEDRIETLQARKQDYLQRFKVAYQRELDQNYANQLNSERIEILVNSVLSETLPESDLPDYDRLMHSLEQDEAIKKIVYNDLVVVLHRKMALIDSILVEKKRDLVLLRRLGQFHEDVILQIEANADVSLTETELTEPATSDELDYASTEGYVTYSEDGGSRLQNSETALASPEENESTEEELLPGNPSATIQAGTGNINPIISDIQTLNVKREQYQVILQTLQKELAE